VLQCNQVKEIRSEIGRNYEGIVNTILFNSKGGKIKFYRF